MAKNNDEVLDKKVRARLREDILSEINTSVKDDLVETVANDVRDTFNSKYKNEIKEEIKRDIVDDIKESVRKDQIKLSRRKSWKIFRLDIYIILLIACSLVLVYRLYDSGNLTLPAKMTKPTESTTTTKQTTTEIHDFSWLKNKYSYLLNNVHIINLDLLKGEFNTEKISNEDKLAMAYKNISSKEIQKEGIISTIKGEILENKYNELFNDNLFKNDNFTIDGLNYAYSESTNSYIAIGEENISTDEILYSIYNIKEDGNKVVISSYVALNRDNKIYNINNLEESVKDNSRDITDVLDKLSKVDYTFEYSNGTFHLVKIANR